MPAASVLKNDRFVSGAGIGAAAGVAYAPQRPDDAGMGGVGLVVVEHVQQHQAIPGQREPKCDADVLGLGAGVGPARRLNVQRGAGGGAGGVGVPGGQATMWNSGSLSLRRRQYAA